MSEKELIRRAYYYTQSFDGVRVIKHPHKVRFLVMNGKQTQRELDNALAWSAGRGYLESTQVLVSAGANIRYHDDLPLYWAAMNGNLNIIHFLVHLGANPHRGIIHEAARCGQLQVVQYLISIRDYPPATYTWMLSNGKQNVAQYVQRIIPHVA